MEQQPTPSGRKPPSNSYLRFGGFAFQLLGGIGIAGWLGHQLDLYFSLKFPAFLLLFILVVLSGMLYQINKKLNEDN
jgi:hypothetical protein